VAAERGARRVIWPTGVFARARRCMETAGRARSNVHMPGEGRAEGIAHVNSRCGVSVVSRKLTFARSEADPRDRRKLTFYFKADKRIDFRDLTKENFRIFKSRIWMAMVPKDGMSGQWIMPEV